MYFYRMIRIVLIGSGNVAKHLYTAFDKTDDVAIVQCYNRAGITLTDTQPQHHVTNSLNELTTDADVYILAVSDDAIATVSDRIPFTDKLVVHTSGSTPMDVLTSRHKRGVFYPLQSFSSTKTVDFSTIPLCLEAEHASDLLLLQQLALSLKAPHYPISSIQRNVLHVAAVFVNNFTNHLYSVGNEICEEHQIPFDILFPLISETALKIKDLPPLNAQTGPAKRNDTNTISRHLMTLTQQQHIDLYKTLTTAIQITHGKKL